MRYAPEHKQQTRQRLLAETAEVIRRQGLPAVSVASVMARLGLTHGGFYAHFGSRDELIAAGVSQMFDEARELVGSAPESLPAKDVLAHYVDAYLSTAHRDLAGSSCPLPVLSAEAPRLPGPARDQYAAGARHLRRLIADRLTELGHPDAEALASSAVAEMIGAVALSRAEPDTARSDAILAASRAQLKRRLGLEATS